MRISASGIALRTREDIVQQYSVIKTAGVPKGQPSHVTHRINTASAGVIPCAANGHMRSAMTRNDLRRKNAHLRDQIAHVVEKDPELPDVTEGIALRQDLHVEVGTPFLERTHGKLQERTRAMIERRPELDRYFDI
jgi:hypothetical protein